ncbi:hypothetical protein GCM10028862_06750 [Luteimonas pelagia]
MSLTLARAAFALVLAFGAVAGARAQDAADATALPIWHQDRLQGFLLLEPQKNGEARWQFGRTPASSQSSLGLLCDRGIGSSLVSLSDCSVATLGAGISRPSGRFGLSVGESLSRLPAWMTPRGDRVEQTDLTVFAERNVGSEGVVSIGGTLARARIVSPGEVPMLADRWSSRTLRVGGSIGNFGASIVGRVVDVPGQPEDWQGYGVGLTWRTPWSGKLSVGADNVVTRGRNPFSPQANGEEEGAIPYVRYEQDL